MLGAGGGTGPLFSTVLPSIRCSLCNLQWGGVGQDKAGLGRLGSGPSLTSSSDLGKFLTHSESQFPHL